MTTLLAWVAADQRGPASIRVAADSRISWSSANGIVLRNWDFGRKVFASYRHPDVVGYCGDVLFPTQTLGQMIELIDRDAFFPGRAEPREKVQLIVEALERAACKYPPEETRDFTIVHCTRVEEYMDGEFHVSIVSFSAGKATSVSPVAVPKKSGVITILGSGANQYRSYLSKWQSSDIGGTSRAMFSSFCEFLRAHPDPKTGGPPQLAGLLRKGAAKSFGIVWDGKLYLMGMEIAASQESREFECYNDFFEICDSMTLQPRDGAQRQPSPFRERGPDQCSHRNYRGG
jgi:hypothetical protein